MTSQQVNDILVINSFRTWTCYICSVYITGMVSLQDMGTKVDFILNKTKRYGYPSSDVTYPSATYAQFGDNVKRLAWPQPIV